MKHNQHAKRHTYRKILLRLFSLAVTALFTANTALIPAFADVTEYSITELTGKYKTQGRTVLENGMLMLDWSASGIIFKANCSGNVKIKVNATRLNTAENQGAYFTVIVNEAPLLCYCETAKNYIFAIDNNQEFLLEKQSVEIDRNYEIPQGKTVKIDKKRVTISIIAILLLIVIICIVSAKYAPSTPEKILKNTQEMTELIFTYEVNNEKDLLCFYNTRQNGLSASFLDRKSEDKYKINITTEGLWTGGKGEIGVAKNDLIIEFAVYDSVYDIPTRNLAVKEFSMEGATAYFCITAVRSEKVFLSYSSYSNGEFDEWVG